MSGWRIELRVAREAEVAPFGAALDPLADAIAAFEIVPGGAWRIEAYAVDEPDQAAVAAAIADGAAAAGIARPPYDIAPLPPVDWLAESFKSFPPQTIGRFWIHGEHVRDRPPAGRVPLLIDAATAFGSGEHATTRLCLAEIQLRLKRGRPRRMLDLGCGSAILALAFAKAARRPALGGEIDPGSVRVARANARLNGEASRVRIVRADGCRHPAIGRRRRWPLVVANILAGPLCRLAPETARRIPPGGTAILSGLLDAQAPQVLAAWRRQRIALVRRRSLSGWSALTLSRRRCGAASAPQ